MNSRTHSKKISVLALLFSLALVFGVKAIPADAAISAYVNKDGSNNFYVYDKDDLIDSYTNYIIFGKDFEGASLFNHFFDNYNPVAVLDSVTGNYVDYKALVSTYSDHVIAGQSFDPNEYTESEAATVYEQMPTVIKEVSVDNTGSIAFKDISVDVVEEELKVLEIY